MKIKLILLDEQEEKILKVKSFEFRANQVTYWFHVYYEDGTDEFFKRVAVFKLIN